MSGEGRQDSAYLAGRADRSKSRSSPARPSLMCTFQPTAPFGAVNALATNPSTLQNTYNETGIPHVRSTETMRMKHAISCNATRRESSRSVRTVRSLERRTQRQQCSQADPERAGQLHGRPRQPSEPSRSGARHVERLASGDLDCSGTTRIGL